MLTPYVEFEDFTDDYGVLLRAAYEKCNIHAPFKSWSEALTVLSDECAEAVAGIGEVAEWVECLEEWEAFSPEEQERHMSELEAETLKTMMELLQVLAVCEKWRQKQLRDEKEW